MAAAARLLIPVLLGALLSTADACLSNSDCSENTFCSVNSEGCEKCFWDWSFGAKCGAHDYCTIRGVQCPSEHQDADMGATYAAIDGDDKWHYKGTLKDGRPWFESDSAGEPLRYLYYSGRAGGHLLSATAPLLGADEPWAGDNNQVRLLSGGAHSPKGTWSEARLYCGHDTGLAAAGCSRHERGGDSNQAFYWCDNNGPVSISCTCGGDWSDAGIEGDDANTFRSMSCAEHLNQEDETAASLANCEAACACEDTTPVLCQAATYDSLASDAICQLWLDAGHSCSTKWEDVCDNDNPNGADQNSYTVASASCTQCPVDLCSMTTYFEGISKNLICDLWLDAGHSCSTKWEDVCANDSPGGSLMNSNTVSMVGCSQCPTPSPPLPSPSPTSCIKDDSKCSSDYDDCCACDASIGQTTCGWEEPATCRDGYLALPTPGAEHDSCEYSCYPPGCPPSPPAGTNSCSALEPCGKCGGDHCTTAGCPFRGYECNALNDNQPNAQPGTCRFNVIDPGYSGYDYYNSGSCQEMCSTFGWDCLRLEEYSDNACGAQFIASYDCNQPVSTYPGHHGHAMCTCSPRSPAGLAPRPPPPPSQFTVFAVQLSWDAAQQDCQARGGELATIHGAEDNAKVLLLLHAQQDAGTWPTNNGYGGAWIGLTDTAQENTFIWAGSAAAATYFNWGDHEPNNSGEEDCVTMWEERADKAAGTWNDGDCSALHPYVCSLSAPPPSPSPPAPGEPHGPDMKFPGWNAAMPGACRSSCGPGGESAGYKATCTTEKQLRPGTKWCKNCGANPARMTQHECMMACEVEPSCNGYHHGPWCSVYGSAPELWDYSDTAKATLTRNIPAGQTNGWAGSSYPDDTGDIVHAIDTTKPNIKYICLTPCGDTPARQHTTTHAACLKELGSGSGELGSGSGELGSGSGELGSLCQTDTYEDAICQLWLDAGHSCWTKWEDVCANDSPFGADFNSYTLSMVGCGQCSTCGTSWGNYVLADSGAPDCTGCGEAITSYDDCLTAARSGVGALDIGPLGESENWSGPPGCHIQDYSNFQFNSNMEGTSYAGHTPICLISGSGELGSGSGELGSGSGDDGSGLGELGSGSGGDGSGSPSPPASPPGTFTSKAPLEAAVQAFNDDSLATTKEYGPIADWDVSAVTDMSYLFYGSEEFNSDISSWNTSGVMDMSGMFGETSAFNQPLSFDTSKVTAMKAMFWGASAFDQPLSFDTSKVTRMSKMFGGANSFNQPLNLDTSKVTTMDYMFYDASAFNQPLSFDASRVTGMKYMFEGASSLSDTNKLVIRCAWMGTSTFRDVYGLAWNDLGACN